MAQLSGKVALITGAGNGMGRSHAELMAARGAYVVVQDIVPEAADETLKKVRAAGGAGRAMVCDVAEVAQFARLAADIEKELGHIDILVNNAGISDELNLEETEEEHFNRMFDVHVKGSFFATRAVVPGMKQRRQGKIINISSIWGMVGHTAESHYCGAKAALLGLTKAWAKEFAPWNIHVNAVAPGGVVTAMVLQQKDIEKRMAGKIARVPLGRYADPIEISYTVAFLASNESDFITGQVISPNGGETIVGI
jgi:3-oxoacyl-[acyl-carrier protein] reductase